MKGNRHICFYFVLILMASILVNGCKCGHFESNSAAYKKACDNLDFATAHEILNHMRAKFETSYQRPRYNAYSVADLDIFKKEVAYLLEQEDMDTRILALIFETPIDGNVQSNFEGVVRKDDGWEYELYSMSIDRINIKCDITLDYCILLGKKELAQKIIPLFHEKSLNVIRGHGHHADLLQKEEPVLIVDGAEVDYGHSYIKIIETHSKEVAEEKFRESFGVPDEKENTAKQVGKKK